MSEPARLAAPRDAAPGETPIAKQALVQIVRALAATPPRAGATRVVAIDGRSGAGKSTLGRALAGALGSAPLVQLEDLYGGWDGLERGVDRLRDDVLRPLAAGERVAVPRYDWHAAAYGPSWPLPAAPPVLVVEGVGAGAMRVAGYCSLLVWVELEADERRRRAFARDGATYLPHWAGWAAQEEAHYARERTHARANVVLDD
ncbi:hypothetical protein Q5424_15735 [Conexibacter sp. JD483]|uniref:hypothetical protein n=1 Tax=unclassified Conexibacter TaxID=2627773 RepID=UPI002721F05E|nr:MULTISPECIES: hypothetical protein [unclassified Conexibacter]MDO8185315.1 hypothetical protein [Conexibacter sp. CPCC 205706]MDO8198361.1 hypothetical protein [Conexibacter sp. CPCC 205762]MDR9370548.1 hypothetical protein [Conexibacter sp. JD483]